MVPLISGCWLTYPSEKIWVRQLGLWHSHFFLVHVPNHQPDKILPTAPCFLTDLRSRCPVHSFASEICPSLERSHQVKDPQFHTVASQLRYDLPPLYIYISIIYIYIHYISVLCYLARLALWTSNVFQKQKSAQAHIFSTSGKSKNL